MQVTAMNLSELNWLAVVVAAVSAFVLGGLWYGPIFGTAWQQQLGLSDEQIASGNTALIFGGSFVLSLVISIGLAGLISAVIPAPALVSGLLLGLEISIVFVAASFGINYLFARHSLALFGIDAGYMILMFTTMGAILGAWR
jgi:hypothetical protein